MKKIFVGVLICGSLSTQVFAGFFGSIVTSAIGSAVVQGGGSKAIYVSKLSKRMHRVNLYLWHMHETKKYTKNYMFYTKWLIDHVNDSGYDDINYLDTIAWVLKDHGKKKEAIKLYEKRILPWVDVRYKEKSKKFRKEWYKSYEMIKK